MFPRISIHSTLLLLLGACANPQAMFSGGAISEQLPPQVTEIPEGAGSGASRTGIIAAGRTADGWLKTFRDPELERIVDEALATNRQTARAAANLKAAERFATRAVSALAGAIFAGGGTQPAEQGDSRSEAAGAALNLDWELAIWNRLGAAAENFPATETELEAAHLSLVAQTSKAWFLANEANLQLELSRVAIGIYAQALEIIETRAETGAVSPQAIALARTDLAVVRERQRQAVAALIDAMRSFEAILGRYPTAELRAVREFVPELPVIPAAISAELIERRPDLTVAERRVAAAFRHSASTRVAKPPSLPLTAPQGFPSSELLALIGGDGEFFSQGANFIAPLDTGGGRMARVRIETAGQESALENYGAAVRRAFDEIANCLGAEALLKRHEKFLATALADNAGALSAVKNRYDTGEADILEVLKMQARVLNSRILLVRIKNARLAQRVDLYLALGGGFGE